MDDKFGQIPSVQQRRAEREAVKQEARAKAEKAWAGATDNQKVGIRFGMTDVDLLKAAGFDPYKDDTREFTLALMDIASEDGGMRA